MIEARPSRTALRVAMRRAAHQLFDNPKVLDDPIALRIVGSKAEAKLRTERGNEFGRFGLGLRAFMAARSRFAEDALARSIARGATQYVVLGAGLDTFAYRNPCSESALRVFEVDFPATQEWKRRQLHEAAIAIPSSVTYAPVDFEHQTLAEGLRLAQFLVEPSLHPVARRLDSWHAPGVHRVTRRRSGLVSGRCAARGAGWTPEIARPAGAGRRTVRER